MADTLVKHFVIRIGGRPNPDDQRYDAKGADEFISSWLEKGYEIKHVSVLQVNELGPTVFYVLAKAPVTE